MLKKDIVKYVAERTELSQAKCDKVLDAFIEVVRDVIAAGGDVKLVGFGTFDCKKKDEHNAKNPRTGEIVHVPASISPRFKFSKTFKKAVN